MINVESKYLSVLVSVL